MILRWIILRLVCMPVDVLGLLLLLGTVGSGRWDLRRGVVWVRLRPGSWLAGRWRWSTTLGHVVLLSPKANDGTVRHELVHVRQAEAVCCAWAFIVVLTGSVPALCLWPAAWLLVYAAASLAAWLGGREHYHGNVFEQQAYKEAP